MPAGASAALPRETNALSGLAPIGGTIAVDTNSRARGTPEPGRPFRDERAYKILVTGNTGCLGPQVLEALARHPVTSSAAIHTLSRNACENPRHCQLDIRDARSLRAFLRALNPTHIIHLAALSSPSAVNLKPDRRGEPTSRRWKRWRLTPRILARVYYSRLRISCFEATLVAPIPRQMSRLQRHYTGIPS